MFDFHAELADRLMRYAALDSQSDDKSPSSTATQFSMLNLLKSELEQIGAAEVSLPDYGTVLATIPAIAPGPTLGFLAHVDTAPQFNATGVKPHLIRGYDDGAISYPDNPNLSLTPERTEGREGFIHLPDLTGAAAQCHLKLILRDFELDGLAAKGALLTELATDIAATEPRATIKVAIKPHYRNLRYWLETDMTPLTLAQTAARSLGLSPVSVPIRGGTDGSRLTEMGIPTPNLFTGMQDIHGPLEWISVQDMKVATQLCLAITAAATT